MTSEFLKRSIWDHELRAGDWVRFQTVDRMWHSGIVHAIHANDPCLVTITSSNQQRSRQVYMRISNIEELQPSLGDTDGGLYVLPDPKYSPQEIVSMFIEGR